MRVIQLKGVVVMKKLIIICIALIVMSSYVYADEVKIYTDNSVINYTIDGHYPYIDELGNTLVPIERTLEASVLL